MKAVIVRAHTVGDREFKVGDPVEGKAQDLVELIENGSAVTTENWNLIQAKEAQDKNIVQARETRVDAALGRLVERGGVAPKDESAKNKIRASALTMEAATEGCGVQFLDSLQASVANDNSTLIHRLTQPMRDDGTVTASGAEVRESVADISEYIIKCTAPQDKLIKSNNHAEALKLSQEAGVFLKHKLMAIAAKGDFLIRNTIKAATFSDPNSQVGSLAADLIIMRNLGYLVNKLAWLKRLTTDLTGEPVKFGASIFTRYITVPDVLTWVPGVGFTSDKATIAMAINDGLTGGSKTDAQIAAANQADSITLKTAIVSGGASGSYTGDNYLIQKKSGPLTTDVSVRLNMFKAVEVEFPVTILSGTTRNLLGEQLGAQCYGLAEAINEYMLGVLFAPTLYGGVAWGTGGVAGLNYTQTTSLANWNLTGMVQLKNRMTIAKIPDVGRFALLHSFYHDALLTDSNLLTAKAILALISKDESGFESGELPTLFGVKPLESQLASASAAGALTSWVDQATLGNTRYGGFAGNMSAALFVSRPPQDFTQIAQQLGIPVTASVRLMTEPDSGMTVMVFSYVDNGRMSISQRVCLMWGGAQGDPRTGILLAAQ
jgi:hypothetical protein